jgi:hypothetical protein
MKAFLKGFRKIFVLALAANLRLAGRTYIFDPIYRSLLPGDTQDKVNFSIFLNG